MIGEIMGNESARRLWTSSLVPVACERQVHPAGSCAKRYPGCSNVSDGLSSMLLIHAVSIGSICEWAAAGSSWPLCAFSSPSSHISYFPGHSAFVEMRSIDIFRLFRLTMSLRQLITVQLWGHNPESTPDNNRRSELLPHNIVQTSLQTAEYCNTYLRHSSNF